MPQRPLVWLAAPALMALIPLGWGACGGSTYDDGKPRPCESDCDCYSGENYELGTRCDADLKLCLCPVEGHALTPCCKKGAPEDKCERQCRKVEECADPPETSGTTATSSSSVSSTSGSGGSSSSGSSGSSSSTGGGASDGQCQTASDCPGPADPVCGTATCNDGVCGLAIKVGPIASQRAGDCHRRDCDVSGKVVDVEDPSDVYNDGEQCTIDLCVQGSPLQKPFTDGAECPETGLGYCHIGSCTVCISDIPVAAYCGVDRYCADTQCVPVTCLNDVKDPDETGPDCGGPCTPCPKGFFCKSNQDCASNVCVSNSCGVPACGDGAKNDGETGVDCGGPPSCKRCPAGEGCKLSSDCESGVCWAGACLPAACEDGVMNGDEEGIDCGGSCPQCP